MKEQIREILWNFVAGEVTDSEATQQVLDLFAVVRRSEQLVCCCDKWHDRMEESNNTCSTCDRKIK